MCAVQIQTFWLDVRYPTTSYSTGISTTRAGLELIGPIASNWVPRLRGTRATPTNLHKLKPSIEAACVAPKRDPQFFLSVGPRKEN